MPRRIEAREVVLDELARRFPQLYVEPADDAGEAYRIAALRGAGPEGATLDHFRGAGDDFLRAYDTPAGQVDVLFLALRLDFERALRCLAFRCRPEEIPATTGAMTISGLADWSKIADERERASAAGEDWPEAFRAFTADPANYRTTLVVVSEGPYSAVEASLTPYDADEWVAVSRQIRIFHELAHVVCIRLMPGDRLAVYDELTADFCGLVHATGTYDTALAATFLGVDEQGPRPHGTPRHGPPLSTRSISNDEGCSTTETTPKTRPAGTRRLIGPVFRPRTHGGGARYPSVIGRVAPTHSCQTLACRNGI